MILIGIGVWLLVVLLILLFFKGADESDNEKLKPLDLEKSKLNINLFDEIRKCNEEDEEFLKAVMKCDIDNVIEEFWDSVQTKLNVMSMLEIPTEMIYGGIDKHTEKMNQRGYVFKK